MFAARGYDSINKQRTDSPRSTRCVVRHLAIRNRMGEFGELREMERYRFCRLGGHECFDCEREQWMTRHLLARRPETARRYKTLRALDRQCFDCVLVRMTLSYDGMGSLRFHCCDTSTCLVLFLQSSDTVQGKILQALKTDDT